MGDRDRRYSNAVLTSAIGCGIVLIGLIIFVAYRCLH